MRRYKQTKVTYQHYDRAFELINNKAYEIYNKEYNLEWGNGLNLLNIILCCFTNNEPCSMFYIKEMEKMEKLYNKSNRNNVSTL